MSNQVEPNHYFSHDYDSKQRFISYWHQINEIINLKPHNVLEIGKGNGFVSSYLRNRGYKITTLDIDKRLKPDVAGSVLDIKLPSQSFDVVACYEVLEHLSYENFSKALKEIYRVCIHYAVISLPDCSRVYRFSCQIPKLGEIKKLIPLKKISKIHKFDGQHYWEIGKKGYPLRKILSDVRAEGFTIEKSYRIFELAYHRFFILKK
jgi:ubiquinone/menaquinone biosynthesis C-methylase UbiE